MKMTESLVALYIYISILLQKKENTREDSLGKIGFDYDAKKLNIKKEKWVDYKCIVYFLCAFYILFKGFRIKYVLQR